MVELITSLVGTLGVTGALVWYLYYNTAVAIPKLTDKHSDTLNAISKNFSDTLRDEREFRRGEMQELKTYIKSEACKHEIR